MTSKATEPHDDPWRDAPESIHHLLRVARPSLKDMPKKFIGRKDELDQVDSLVERTMHPVATGHPAAPAITLIGAPGAGKSSLMDHLESHLRYRDYTPLVLTPEDVGDAQRLTKKIRGQPPWSDVGWLRKVFGKLSDGLAKATDGLISTGFSFGAGDEEGEWQVSLKQSDAKPVQNVLEAWLNDQPADPVDTLKLLNGARKAGTIILMDEAQLLDIHVGASTHAHARDIIRGVASPKGRKEHGIDRLLLIAAGLNNTPLVLRDMGTPRTEDIRMGRLSEQDVLGVIAAGISAGLDNWPQPTTDAERVALLDAWLPPLISEFDQWPHHTQGAAQAATDVLKTVGAKDAIAPWGLATVCRLGRRYQRQLYKWIEARAHEDHLQQITVKAVAHAMRTNANHVDRTRLDLLVQWTDHLWAELEPPNPNLKRRQSTIDDKMRQLLRVGVLEGTDTDPDSGIPAGYRIPIPSFLDFLTAGAVSDLDHEIITKAAEKARLTVELPA